jgi:hypothetical protein
MVQYYYLVASLPTLVLGDAAPLTLDEFRSMCEASLSEEDLRELECVLAGRFEDGVSTFCRDWLAVETQLRNALVRVRATQHGVDPSAYLHEHAGYEMAIEKAVTDAYTKPNPQERELSLDRFRWKRVDDLAQEELFGLPAVLAYALHLVLVQRWTAMDLEKGQARAEDFINTNMEKIGPLEPVEQ